MKPKTLSNELKIRINCVIHGEPAEWLMEWKKRGIVRSNPDAVNQAFRSFQEKLLASRLFDINNEEGLPVRQEKYPRRSYS